MKSKKYGLNVLTMLAAALSVVLWAPGCSGQGEKNPAAVKDKMERGTEPTVKKHRRSPGLQRYIKMRERTTKNRALSTDITPVKNPSPTHIETSVPVTKLDRIREISDNIDNEHFMAAPRYVTADNDGNTYIMDIRQKTIIKLSKEFKYLTSFGEAGVGPGQFGDTFSGNEIYFSPRWGLTVGDASSHRITHFSPEGKFIKDFKIKIEGNPHVTFSPVISPNGEVFVRTGVDSTLDVYQVSGIEAVLKYRLLGKEYFKHSLHHHIRVCDEEFFSGADEYNLSYHPLPDGRLMVYLHAMSELIIFNRDIPEKRFYLWPDRVLKEYMSWKREDALKSKDRIFTPSLFWRSFFDGDDDSHLYLSGFPTKAFIQEHDKPRQVIYKFNRDGKLLEIFYIQSMSMLICKKNGFFYGINFDDVEVFGPSAKKGSLHSKAAAANKTL